MSIIVLLITTLNNEDMDKLIKCVDIKIEITIIRL